MNIRFLKEVQTVNIVNNIKSQEELEILSENRKLKEELAKLKDEKYKNP